MGTTTPVQNGPKSNGNEVALHIPQSFRTQVSQSDGLESYLGHTCNKGVYQTCRGAVGVFYYSSRLVWKVNGSVNATG